MAANRIRLQHADCMDAQYLDKNYAGMLIVWDRMFGTFQPEVFRPHYGLTTPVNTFNSGKLQTREYVAIAQDVRRASRWRERLGYVFGTLAGRPNAERRLVVEESTEVRT
jgi:hypothetical protein